MDRLKVENMQDLINDPEQLSRDLAEVLSKHGIDIACDIPNFVLGDMVVDTLTMWATAAEATKRWGGAVRVEERN